jgi:hypothetical protein
MGLGAILLHAAKGLYAAQAFGVDVALRFTSPTYAPSSGQGDWLEHYFVRLGSRPDARPVCDSRHVPGGLPGMAAAGKLVWGALRIRDELLSDSIDIPPGPFAAVHFRGSDKFLETPRPPATAVLDVVEREMAQQGLERLFVASDEPEFTERAKARFGPVAFWLPIDAVASADGTPPHFRRIAGEVKAREALTTMFILSRAKLVVKTDSLLSDWANTLAANQRVVGVRVNSQRSSRNGSVDVRVLADAS